VKLRARCVRVDDEKFKLQNEFDVFIPKKDNEIVAENFIPGKTIEVLTDASPVFIVQRTELRLAKIYRCRLVEPISFKGII
jgi:hypothetical protein